METIERFTKVYLSATKKQRQRLDDIVTGVEISMRHKEDGHISDNPKGDSDVPSDRQQPVTK